MRRVISVTRHHVDFLNPANPPKPRELVVDLNAELDAAVEELVAATEALAGDK